MAKIKQIISREILNAKGNPSVETTVVLSDGSTGTSSCPSGTSVSKYEALELVDNDPNRFKGLGVLKAIKNIDSIIAPMLIGMDALKQAEIDKKMISLDGTLNKDKLGANAILSISMSIAKAAAKSSSLPLFLYLREYIKTENMPLKIPTPAFNIVNGGKHAFNSVDFQEFLLIPASSNTFNSALTIGSRVYDSLKQTLETKNLSTLVGDEGGFAPKLATNQEAIATINEAITAIKFRLGFDVYLGIDAASSSFYSDGKYHIKDEAKALSADDLIAFYQTLEKTYNLLYLEDGLSEDDWEGWRNLYTKMSEKTLIVGDDLVSTNPFRLQEALSKKAISAIIIKPNQIGTVIETLAVVEMARQAGLKIVVSHRSGETNDDFIADFAVAVNADYTKFGAPARGERIAKYNRLLQIENQLKTL